MIKKRLKLTMIFLVAAVIGVGGGLTLRAMVDGGIFSRQFLVADAPAIGGPFSLVDQHGERVTDADFRGRFMLLFFGYTFCPDVCPTELQDMVLALDELGAEGDKVQLVFITIDPERDSVEVLAEYASLFHPKLVALTGSAQEIAAVAKAYGVYYAKSKVAGSDAEDHGTYLMDHSTSIYLLRPNGRYATRFSYGTPIDEIARGIRRFL